MSTKGDISNLTAGLKQATQAKLKAALNAVDIFGEKVLGDAQQLTPVLTGFLQGSATAEPAKQKADGGISKEIGFGAEYAIFVHENLHAHHDIGQAKFLEKAMRENEPKLAPFVAAAVANVP